MTDKPMTPSPVDPLAAIRARADAVEAGNLLNVFSVDTVRQLLALCDQQAETLKQAIIDGENKATRLADKERRRWYAAFEPYGFRHLEGLSPEVVAGKVADKYLGHLRDLAGK